MNSKERLLAAMRRQPVDRVPANITYYMPAFFNKHFPVGPDEDAWEVHLNSLLGFGFDPQIGLGGGGGQPWQRSEAGRWDVLEERQELASDDERYLVTWTAETPARRVSTTFCTVTGKSGWQEEPLIKVEEDLLALDYLPAPVVDVDRINARHEQLGDRGLGNVSINGIWQQACYLRGMEQMAMDPYINPEWTRRFLGRVADDLAAQAEALCQSKAETFFINESYLGMGISPHVFDAFVRPYDERFVRIAKDAGKLVLYHDCGMCDALLESFVDMGIDYLESLNPKAASGDVEPVDAKRRVGGHVSLRGGFNHHVLSYGTPKQVRAEALRSLAQLSPGGGYILCPAAPIDEGMSLENLQAFADTANELCGAYGDA